MLVLKSFCYLHSIMILQNALARIFSASIMYKLLCVTCVVWQEDIGVQAAVTGIYATQPLLFRMENKLWVKVDNSTFELSTASCFAEAVELLLACFWVFNAEYPYHVKPAYEVLEFLTRINSSPSAAVAREFTRGWEI